MNKNQKGKNNSNYKHGLYCKGNKCIEIGCNRNVFKKGTRCKYHAGITHSKRMKGKNNPNFGNPLNMRGKNHPRFKDGNFLKKHYCPECNKEIHPYAKYCHIHANTGDRNSNYIDGRHNIPYPLEFNNELREFIRKRDNYTCQKCNIKEKNYKRTLDIHHIDYDKENNKKDNLITLCNKCNNEVNKDKKFWILYLTKILKKEK